MIREIRVARDGRELGAWPFDVIFALIRSESLAPTDSFWIKGMEEWKPLSAIIPPLLPGTQGATFLGRDDEEAGWGFYCRDGSIVVGPRPVDEIMALIFIGGLSDNHLVHVASSERWISVADLLGMIEQGTPGFLSVVRRIQAASAEQAGVTDSEKLGESPAEWLNTAGNLAMLSPHLAMGYLGWRGLGKLVSWLNEPTPEVKSELAEIPETTSIPSPPGK
jgi:hypothetical protein